MKPSIPSQDPRSSLFMVSVDGGVPIPASAPSPSPVSSRAIPSNERLDALAGSFAAQDDARGFNLLYGAMEHAFFAVVRRVGVPDDAVDDVVNTAADAVWRQRRSFRGRNYKQLLHFALRIAERKAVSWQRHDAVVRRVEVLQDDPKAPCVGAMDFDPHALSVEEIATLHEALRRLSPRERLVLTARTEGKTWKQVAAMATVSFSRARQIYLATLRSLRAERR